MSPTAQARLILLFEVEKKKAWPGASGKEVLRLLRPPNYHRKKRGGVSARNQNIA